MLVLFYVVVILGINDSKLISLSEISGIKDLALY